MVTVSIAADFRCLDDSCECWEEIKDEDNGQETTMNVPSAEIFSNASCSVKDME